MNSKFDFIDGLTLLFIAFKMLGVTDVAQWSWWWVLSPMWISGIVALVFLVIAAAVKGH